ncbi:hypothetical protein ZIOFF_024429 [Zingiber officinale]|uniref:Uncharacterized protein n=1 Tax=Zingiber officinale TaxID=94328 RepID=A0A8J5H8C7_ZINOF|nr:hypothetical protein ZIOFF_024429 [Zingiber officinale]
MSFLAGRLAATEGAYFLHESKNVVSRHAQKLPPTPLPSLPVAAEARSKIADVLPEILRHDVPLKGISTADASSLSASSKWLVRGSSSSSSSMVSPDSLNPLRAYVSLPQATFGPKRSDLRSSSSTIYVPLLGLFFIVETIAPFYKWLGLGLDLGLVEHNKQLS